MTATMDYERSDELERQFLWTPQPAAAELVREIVDDFLSVNSMARELASRMATETGTRFIDWIDHIRVGNGRADLSRWRSAGFVETTFGDRACYTHPGGIFPELLIEDSAPERVTLHVDSVADFASVHSLDVIEGAPGAALRQSRVCSENGTELWVVERHGYRGFNVPATSAAGVAAIARHREAFRTRRRVFGPEANDEAGFANLERLVADAIAEIGRDRACDLFFAAEREYWQRRNRAARVQFARQEALGLGWGNDDHHTYRSSRVNFARSIALFEQLGFACRERFYAGRDAGWGAQVLENPVTQIVIFADVDMSPDELLGDFSHEGLAANDTLGTVGLWCALHGDSILEAGMHHLECTFDHALLREQLAFEHIETMDPFTSFPYLQQAFTRGEIWPVRPARIEALLRAGQITSEQATQFRQYGALGSHLENLERNDGFKGFNQDGVSEIIAATDARRHLIFAGA